MLPKQQKFAEEYVKDHHGTNAAKRAGYSEVRAHVTASELLKRPDVSAYVGRLELEQREGSGVTIPIQLAKLRQVFAGALEDGSWGAAIKAIELESKMMGLLIERRESVTIEHRVFTLGFDRDIIDD